MNVLHIHQDYPDGRDYPYTLAVANLIKGCQELKPEVVHTVVSINRTSNPFKMSVNNFEQGISFVYWGIPLPYLCKLSMKLSSLFMFNKIKHLKVDVIHAHKLTCEGVFAYYFAKKLHIPYVISIRGGSDSHNLSRLSVDIRLFTKIYKAAAQIYWVSAWAQKSFPAILDINEEEMLESKLLPNICEIEPSTQVVASHKRINYLTAISFHQYKRKGILELIQAIALLKIQGVRLTLDIYGSGPEKAKNTIIQQINEYNLTEQISLKGMVSRGVLREKMAGSKGFLMPATNETFGMAYVEALAVGCPILYVKNTGIDGYFDDHGVGVGIAKQDVREIKTALEYIEKNNGMLCQSVAKILRNDVLVDFTQSAVASNYLQTMDQVYNHV
jgi:glycosyltransferase involved in cell wall biosynthesis